MGFMKHMDMHQILTARIVKDSRIQVYKPFELLTGVDVISRNNFTNIYIIWREIFLIILLLKWYQSYQKLDIGVSIALRGLVVGAFNLIHKFICCYTNSLDIGRY